jgi:hypothetical protein
MITVSTAATSGRRFFSRLRIFQPEDWRPLRPLPNTIKRSLAFLGTQERTKSTTYGIQQSVPFSLLTIFSFIQ